jgi:hypothetical protein
MSYVMVGIICLVLGASLSAVGFLSFHIWRTQKPEPKQGLEVDPEEAARAISGQINYMNFGLEDLGLLNGTVYFIGNAGRTQVKIGYTEREPEKRVKNMQTGNPFPLAVLATMPGRKGTEAYLHEVFAPVRLSGEWFELSPTLEAFIASLNRTEGSFTRDVLIEDTWDDEG